jgi:hypothetical protein
MLFISDDPSLARKFKLYLRTLLQLQGGFVPISGTRFLVWNHDDHLSTLHHRPYPQLQADVPVHSLRNPHARPLFRQRLVPTKDAHCQRHLDCHRSIECTFHTSLRLTPCYGITRDSVLSSPCLATWFLHGGRSFYGDMIGEWSQSFPSACLGPLVCALGQMH